MMASNYCEPLALLLSSLLKSLSSFKVRKFQSVQSSLARVVNNTTRNLHITVLRVYNVKSTKR